jgi:hypothetical protein
LRRALGLLAALGALAGCGSKNAGPPIYTPLDGGVPPTTGAGGTPMMGPPIDPGPSNGTVLIEIMSPAVPAAGAPPPSLSVNAAADVSARITIAGMGVVDLVDPASARMTLTQTMNATIISSSPLVGPSGDNQYRGKLSLAGLKSGDYTITISARSTTGALGSASVNVKVDAGPVVTVLSPVPGGHYKTSLFVQLAADPGTLGPLSEAPQASIGGQPVMLQPAGPANQYRAPFDLEKPLPLLGEQLFVVSATNSAGTRTEIRFVIIVDVEGPVITNTHPIPGQIVGGVVKFSADIEDGAGLNDSSIQVLIGDKTNPIFRLALKNEIGTKTYSALFDTKNLTACKLNTDPCIVRPTMSVRAADLLGNETTISYEFAVDNIPPIADLVPPEIYVWKYDLGMRCSHRFDPLSRNTYNGDAPDDGCLVPQMFDLRARIEDDGNHAAGLKQIPISTVDPEATAAYILDTTVLPSGEVQPLVVDTDGDGYCDAVNPKLEPTTSPLQGPRQVLKVRLAPVPPAGVGDFATPDPTLPLNLVGGGVCLAGRDVDPPFDLCRLGPQPSIAISYAGGLPAIWAAEPVAPKDAAFCFGSQLDTKANNVIAVKSVNPPLAGAAGWKCVAIVTADMNGNSSTSQPIRVYLDDYRFGGLAPDFCPNKGVAPAGAGPPPNCTGTYNKTTGAVSQTACKTRNFKLGGNTAELCERGDCGIPQEFQ